MATADQIKALVRSHVERDDSRFYAIAIQVAAQEARNGHGRLAVELREIVDRAKELGRAVQAGPGPKPIPMVQPRGDLAALLTVRYPDTRLVDMALEDDLKNRIEAVVREQRQRARIREFGLSPLRKLLLVGPPGTGKTMTASALAGELGIPLFSIQLDGLITKFMGETAAKLRLVFDAVQTTRGVYLFDEFDALGSQRGQANDVGEIRRVLNSFLSFLENDGSDSVVIGASNHAELLDRALFRRFDAILEYSLPTKEVAETIIRSRLCFLEAAGVEWDGSTGEVIRECGSLSHAEITLACRQAAKNVILAETSTVREIDLVSAIRDRRKIAQVRLCGGSDGK